MNRLPGLDLLPAIVIVWMTVFDALVGGHGSPSALVQQMS